MRLISAEAFHALIAGAELLRSDGGGPKVCQTPDGRVIKLFRLKRWLSSALLYPYAWRFRRNSLRLKRMGLVSVDVLEVLYCPAIHRHAVIYRRLDGIPLDQILRQRNEAARETFLRYAQYVATLHAARVYFRSLHPGNVLMMPDGSFGLIDVDAMRIPRLPLGVHKRRRNFQHMLCRAEFRDALKIQSAEDFIGAYLDAARLGAKQTQTLRRRLNRDFAPYLPPISQVPRVPRR